MAQKHFSVPVKRSAQEFSELAHLIYEAAALPQHWPRVVEAVARSLGASKGLLFTPMMGPQDGGFVFPWQISEQHLQLWATQYIEDDVWADRIVGKGLWIEGNVVTDELLMPREEFLASRFYGEFLSTLRIGRLCAGIIFDASPGLPHTGLSVFRDVDAPPFTPQDTGWLRMLVPHLSRSLGLMHRLNSVRQQAASMMAALDRLSFGVVLLDSRTQVLHLNAAAHRVVGRRDGIELNAHRQLAGPGATNAAQGLAQWLLAIRDQGLNDAAHFCDSFMVTRSGTASRYAVQCSGLAATEGWQAQGQAVRFVVFITDPDAAQLPDMQRLRQIYGFTQTQARVARALASGRSYKQVATELGMSEQTVSSHVKDIYPKARVNRQSDLARAIMAIGNLAV